MSPTKILILVVLVSSCSKPGDDSNAKRSPSAEPAPNVKLPENLKIPIDFGGKVVQTIGVADLRDHKPDFQDDDRQAWRLDALIETANFPEGSVIEAVGADGVGISMRYPKNDEQPLPVLVLTRRGVVVAAAISASDPFPGYHGQGGRLRRPGDPMPRLLTALAKLHVSVPSLGAKAKPATMENLQIQIGDGLPTQISKQQIAALPSSKIMGDSGEQRTLWNLRDLATEVAGEEAWVRSVLGDQTVAISKESWGDGNQQPVLQMNRRGLLKFQWQTSGGPATDGSVHGVTRIVIER